MIILGLNAYHGDAAACLVRDGRLVAAAEEERFRRIKHWAGFPAQAIAYCLQQAGVTLADVAIVAINSDPRANALRKIAYALCRMPSPHLLRDRLRNHSKRRSIGEELAAAFPGQRFGGEVQRIEHHMAHLASAFLVSPFEDACVVSIDGFGDFSSAAWGIAHGADITIDARVHFPHSLGVFYQALTQYLGFPHYGDEYKVMGLAPYGEPRFGSEMERIVRLTDGGAFALDTRFFRHHRERVDYAWSGGSPHVGTLYSPALVELLGPARQAGQPIEPRHRDIARSVQAMYEDAFLHLIRHLHARHRVDNLAIAGGCAMNSVANGKILRQSPFKRLYVQPAAGDAGGAIGAAFIARQRAQRDDRSAAQVRAPAAAHTGETARFVMDHAYWGPEATPGEIAALIAGRQGDLDAADCRIEEIADEDALCATVADSIARGAVVGWFQGRMEWGPRALGNRSIVCDPRRADMKDILNLKIKRRESFRPFAPSILREHVAEWFETDDDVPFMMQVYQIRAAKRPLIPAVTHVDGSGRLQTVHRTTNPRYWKLIEAFRSITGLPLVLNTSFNENEPVVCRPAEALDCFLRTDMDALVLGDWLVRRLPREAGRVPGGSSA